MAKAKRKSKARKRSRVPACRPGKITPPRAQSSVPASLTPSAADSPGPPTSDTPPPERVCHALEAVAFDVGPPTIEPPTTHHLRVKYTDHKKPGRPTSKDRIRQRAQERLAASSGWKNSWRSLRQLAIYLSNWLADEHPTEPQMVPKGVERAIADIWRQHKKSTK
jgi:hypothetical protein